MPNANRRRVRNDCPGSRRERLWEWQNILRNVSEGKAGFSPALASRANGKRFALRSLPIAAFICQGVPGRQSALARRLAGVVDGKCCMFFALI
jgi:hypothetical protein